MNFNPMNFITNLPYLVKGVLGTFVALALIALCTIALNKISDTKKK